MSTIRQKMIDCLSRQTCGVRDLSQLLRISEKEVYAHLPHIARSVASRKRTFRMTPPECLSCGYVFEVRKRFTKPGRCPCCKGERIEEPRYRIAGNDLPEIL